MLLWLAVSSIWLLATLGCANFGLRREPPPPGRTKLSSPLVVLPAKTIGNFIILEAKWDKQGPYHFVVDTGSANTLVTPTLARRFGTGIPPANAPRVHVASAEGDLMELASARMHRLEFGDARFEDVPVLIYDCAALSAHLGIRIDGVLGFPLFRDTRLTLDYPRDRVLLEPANTQTPLAGSTVRFDDRKKTPIIEVKLGQRSVLVLIDSGSDATFSLNPMGLDTAFASGPRRGATVGTIAGDHPQQIGRLAEDIAIGGFTLEKPIVDLTDELSAIGGGVLKYFAVTFDASNDRVTFHRDTLAPIAMPPRRSAGVSFSKTQAYWRVASVIPDSPAGVAGIQFGDLVTRIEGEPVAKWNLTRYEDLVTSADEITFTLLFGTNEVERRVKVFNLVP